MGKHRDEWSREIIAQLVWLGYTLSRFLPLKVEVEHKIHRGFVDVVWYTTVPSTDEKMYVAVFEVETSKSEWPRIRSNAAKIIMLKPLICFHIFKPGIRLKRAEKEELINIHHGRKVYIVNTKKAICNLERDLAEAFSREQGLDFKKLILHVPRPHLERIDWLIDKGFYTTRDEAIRFSVVHLLNEELGGIAPSRYLPCLTCGSWRVYLDFRDKKFVCMKCGKVGRLKDRSDDKVKQRQ